MVPFVRSERGFRGFLTKSLGWIRSRGNGGARFRPDYARQARRPHELRISLLRRPELPLLLRAERAAARARRVSVGGVAGRSARSGAADPVLDGHPAAARRACGGGRAGARARAAPP